MFLLFGLYRENTAKQIDPYGTSGPKKSCGMPREMVTRKKKDVIDKTAQYGQKRQSLCIPTNYEYAVDIE